MKNVLTLLAIYSLFGCALEPVAVSQKNEPEILTVHNDGSMEFRDRSMNADDVVIYQDGFGGERAAVKVRVPLKSDYYRDSIRVYREGTDTTITQN